MANGGRCRAFTLIEMIVASVLLTTVFVTISPILSWISGQNHMSLQRQFALQEVENAMEDISRLRRELITQESLRRIKLSNEAERFLKQARLNIKVSDASGTPTAKRITIELTWKNRSHQDVTPVQLTTWFVY